MVLEGDFRPGNRPRMGPTYSGPRGSQGPESLSSRTHHTRGTLGENSPRTVPRVHMSGFWKEDIDLDNGGHRLVACDVQCPVSYPHFVCPRTCSWGHKGQSSCKTNSGVKGVEYYNFISIGPKMQHNRSNII